MKTKLHQHSKILVFLAILFSVGLFYSCKNIDDNNNISPKSSQRISSTCNSFSYPDTLFFKSNQNGNLIIPATNSQTGTYGVRPEGLSINTTTGAINVTLSESGLKYRVYFVPANTTDTCFRFVTISGVDYLSKIYNLGNNEDFAIPSYKGLTPILPCSDGNDDDDDDDNDDDNECEFDDGNDDDDGDGTGDEPATGHEVIPQGIEINKLTGKIDLRKTLQNGALGSNPVNGTTKLVRIYYRITDNSQKALNFIEVKFHYYQTVGAVPQSLLNQIANKNSSLMVNSARTNKSSRLEYSKPRPPDIIVCGLY
jgi:hypothetical protein